VSSAHEAAALRSRLGADAYLVTPGIRLAHGAPDDQARVMTPAQAVRAGANALVVGRPITGAPDPAAALADVLRDAGSAT
jgi:orotidine-5'-phosphate decarboxylase